MILAAGRGTRLGTLGQSVPKVLLDVGGQPLLARNLDLLRRQGVRRVVVNAHHRADLIEAFVAHYRGPLELVVVVEEQLLGTAGGVRHALSHLEPGPFIVLYGDVLVDEPLDSLLELHRRAEALATIAVHEADSAEGKGTVELDPTGRVTRFVEKEPNATGPALINSGVYVLERDLIAPLADGVPCDFGHDLLPAAVQRGEPVYAARLAKPVIDIGTPAGLADARAIAEGRMGAGGTSP
jgi:NDP-sugar pyrophosphorylase family protein